MTDQGGAPTGAPLRVLLVDDEGLARRALRQLLDVRTDVVVVAECGEVDSARRYLDVVDAVLLDIEMPGQSGIELARERSALPLPALVFVTAFDRYAVPAFATEALDYLCKPVMAPDLDRAIRRVREHVRHHGALPQSSTPPAPRPTTSSALVVRTGRTEERIPLHTVECVEADDVYAAVYADGRRWLIRQSLSMLVASLPEGEFLRVHRSWLVRREAVRALRSGPGGVHIILQSGKRIPVSRRSAAVVRAWVRGRGS